MENTYNYNIIIEGQDRCGKDTQIDLICKELGPMPCHVLHYSNLKWEGKKSEIIKASKLMYKQAFSFIKNKAKYNLIFNRCHLGEYVYGKLYRKYSDKQKEYIFKLEDKIKDKENVYLIVLADSSDKRLNRDDNKSFSKELKNSLAEFSLFKEAFEKSQIKKKLFIDIANKSIDEVYQEIYNFLFKEI